MRTGTWTKADSSQNVRQEAEHNRLTIKTRIKFLCNNYSKYCSKLNRPLHNTSLGPIHLVPTQLTAKLPIHSPRSKPKLSLGGRAYDVTRTPAAQFPRMRTLALGLNCRSLSRPLRTNGMMVTYV